MSQEYDPLITPLQRRWNILVSAFQEIAETMPLLVGEIQRLRQRNKDLEKLLEDKKGGEVKP